MLRKKEVYTQITPINSLIPRQLAIDLLHSHGEIITINPLVLDYKQIKAPRDAEADEFYSTWYEITERVQFMPGIGKLGSGKISFKGCFHDMPWGIQTHMLIPMGIDMRNKWRICGNQPGEPAEARELGIGAPANGLYLREDIEIKCNITMVSFVKSQMKAAAKTMVDRMLKKAELLDSGALQAMMEDGKLKTINPSDVGSHGPVPLPSPSRMSVPTQPPGSPGLPYQVPKIDSQYGPQSPPLQHAQMQHPQYPGYPSQYPQQYAQQYPQQMQYPQQYAPQYAQQGQPGQQGAVMELPGDSYHPQHSPSFAPNSPYNQHLRPASNISEYSQGQGSPHLSNAHWSTQSRPISNLSDSTPHKSPGLDHGGFIAELPTMNEGTEEQQQAALRKLEGSPRPPVQPDQVPEHTQFKKI
ncbi:hypothetical protein BT63DRAFT_428688 [Microthyrium microscopicum]|uniref:DUF7053 domain-containing protein n=1 Tax=Microthyrium microscopicum TaxID=703497 RepID=A0A6A6U1F5_9PEZI|nr:hypothetical protein BT63DRAFT_428688 [Microthyrium microscopicum]